MNDLCQRIKLKGFILGRTAGGGFELKPFNPCGSDVLIQADDVQMPSRFTSQCQIQTAGFKGSETRLFWADRNRGSDRLSDSANRHLSPEHPRALPIQRPIHSQSRYGFPNTDDTCRLLWRRNSFCAPAFPVVLQCLPPRPNRSKGVKQGGEASIAMGKALFDLTMKAAVNQALKSIRKIAQ